MNLTHAKIKVPGTTKSVALVNGHPDFRTKEGRQWKLRQEGAGNVAKKPAAKRKRKGRANPQPIALRVPEATAPVIPDGVRNELHSIGRAVKLTEIHLRDFAAQLRPSMKARDVALLRNDLQKEADRLFFVLYPHAL